MRWRQSNLNAIAVKKARLERVMSLLSDSRHSQMANVTCNYTIKMHNVLTGMGVAMEIDQHDLSLWTPPYLDKCRAFL